MYEIAVCDDDAVFSSEFKKELTKALDARKISCHLTFFEDTSSLMQAFRNGQRYSLIFLDIYAVESYDAAPLHYLLKPVSREKLETALERFLIKNTPRLLHFTTSKGHLSVPIADILFFEIYGHEIIIHKTDKTTEYFTGTLKELEHLLPPLSFVRPHRSYLVSLSHISEITRYRIRLSSGDLIPISKNLYQHTQDCFIDYADKRSLFV